MDREAWRAVIHGVAKSRTWLSDWTELNWTAPWKKSYDQPRQHIKQQRHYLANKGPSSQSYGFSSSQVRRWELDYKESWAPKNWCFWTVVLEKSLESPLDCKEIQPDPKEYQSWIFTGRTDAEAETPILWTPEVKKWLVRKDPDAGKDWLREQKGMTEDEMLGWHHWLDGRESEWTPGDGDGQGGLACCDSWGCKESDTTERLNWTELNWTHLILTASLFFMFLHHLKPIPLFSGSYELLQESSHFSNIVTLCVM